MAAVETASPTMGTAAACAALGVARASVYRRRHPARLSTARPPPPRALDPGERQAVLETLHSERFLDQAPAQVHATLLDEGTYLCSPRTMYRLLDAAGEVKERRDQVRRPHYAAPELLATRPNEVWSWDITKLLGPAKWTYFYLYVILDIFSRYVVGWMLAPRESAALAKLRVAGIRTSQERVRRLMREHDLQAPHRVGHAHGPKAHDGTITTDAPDVMWGPDMTATVTIGEGSAFVFVAVDHCTTECIGLHAAKRGSRFEALEPIRQGVRERFGAIGKGVAPGLRLRHDHGSNYLADDFQQEVAFFGIESSPSFVREPEGNGVAERFIRTLKENVLGVRSFDTIEELRLALLEFKRTYNEQWMLEKYNYRSPAQVRRDLVGLDAAA